MFKIIAVWTFNIEQHYTYLGITQLITFIITNEMYFFVYVYLTRAYNLNFFFIYYKNYYISIYCKEVHFLNSFINYVFMNMFSICVFLLNFTKAQIN